MICARYLKCECFACFCVGMREAVGVGVSCRAPQKTRKARSTLTHSHAGLVEIRTIPTKKDIAFIEYADEPTAIVAKEALHNFKIDGETKMKVTYARK